MNVAPKGQITTERRTSSSTGRCRYSRVTCRAAESPNQLSVVLCRHLTPTLSLHRSSNPPAIAYDARFYVSTLPGRIGLSVAPELPVEKTNGDTNQETQQSSSQYGVGFAVITIMIQNSSKCDTSFKPPLSKSKQPKSVETGCKIKFKIQIPPGRPNQNSSVGENNSTKIPF